MVPVWLGSALAAEPDATDPPAPPDAAEARLSALEAELAALREELAREEQEDLLREAEALAATAPPPPTPPPTSAAAFNPQLTAFGDVLGTVGVEGGEVLPTSGPWVRSLELDLRAAVDPFAKAVAVFAVEQEPPLDGGELAFEAAAEELYVDFVALPAGFSVQAGGFRQPFGVTNRAHPHDYPWPDTPLPLSELLGEEGLNQVGAVATWRVPNPWGKGFTLAGGANDGSRFDPASTTAAPAWISRAEVFDRAGIVDWGLGGSATGLGEELVAGGDLVIRIRPNQFRSLVLLGEVLTDLDALGGYAAVQLQPFRQLYLGARADLLDEAHQAGGWVSYYTSEFLRLRAGARVDTAGLLVSDAQLTFVWGSHPVEPYWVNR